MKKTRYAKRISAVIMACIVLAGAFWHADRVMATGSGPVTISMVGKYDSADTAAIRSIDLDQKKIRFRNHLTGKTYTLSYDNTSMMYDVHGAPLSPQLLEEGEIVKVTFLKSTKHITTLDVSDNAWTIEDTRDHDLVRGDGSARVKGDIYKLDQRTLVLAEGNIALPEDVLKTDTVRVSGIGNEIYSVVVTGGHGYVSLSSDTVENQSLVGAWLELDNEVIYKISPNMLLSAPEGDYTLQILGNGANYQSEVNISRNQETVVDTSSITITKAKEGMVTFDITPENADVFVDGEKKLTGVPQSIKYGYHNLKIMADGYITQNRYLKVGTAKSVVSIELEKDSDDSDSSNKSLSTNTATVHNSTAKASMGTAHADVGSSKKSSTASTAATVSSNSSGSKSGSKVIKGYKIYVDEPYGAELYLDGNYIGVIPTSFTKVSGNHEFILKKEGYETKSFRVNIDDEEVDETYTFKMKKEDGGSSSNSSNNASTAASSAASTASTEKDDSGKDASSDASTTAKTEVPTESASEASKTEEGGSGSSGSSKEEHSSHSSSKEEAVDAASAASGAD